MFTRNKSTIAGSIFGATYLMAASVTTIAAYAEIPCPTSFTGMSSNSHSSEFSTTPGFAGISAPAPISAPVRVDQPVAVAPVIPQNIVQPVIPQPAILPQVKIPGFVSVPPPNTTLPHLGAAAITDMGTVFNIDDKSDSGLRWNVHRHDGTSQIQVVNNTGTVSGSRTTARLSKPQIDKKLSGLDARKAELEGKLSNTEAMADNYRKNGMTEKASDLQQQADGIKDELKTIEKQQQELTEQRNLPEPPKVRLVEPQAPRESQKPTPSTQNEKATPAANQSPEKQEQKPEPKPEPAKATDDSAKGEQAKAKTAGSDSNAGPDNKGASSAKPGGSSGPTVDRPKTGLDTRMGKPTGRGGYTTNDFWEFMSVFGVGR